jgi:hypothetical protein
MTVLFIVFQLSTLQVFYDYLWINFSYSQKIVWCGYHEDVDGMDDMQKKCMQYFSLIQEDVYVLCIKTVPVHVYKDLLFNSHRIQRLWVFESEQLTFEYSVAIYKEIYSRFSDIRYLHYSDANLRLALQHGVSSSKNHYYLPLQPCTLDLYKKYWTEKKVYDVVFVGTQYTERLRVIKQIRTAFNVTIVEGFGDYRDKIVSQSKILVNIHSDHNRILESVRCVPAFLSGTIIVTEKSEKQSLTSIERQFIVSELDELVATIGFALKHYDEIFSYQMRFLETYHPSSHVHCQLGFELDKITQ